MDQMSSYLRRFSEAKKGDFEAKVVLLRLDLDVPMKEARGKRQEAEIGDTSRLEETLPTVKWLLQAGARVIAIGHLGRPKVDENFQISKYPNSPIDKWQIDSPFSLKPVYEWYQSKLGNNPNFRMLENLRFDAGEEENSAEFAKKLVAGTGAELYVFEAFAVSHRAHASITQIPKLLPTYEGIRFEKEIENLQKVTSYKLQETSQNEKKQKVLVMGGAKGETKIPLIKNLSSKFDQILVGGRIPLEVTRDKLQVISQKIEIKFAKLNPDGLDITEESAREFAEIVKNAGTVVWNGPMGKFEEFAQRQETRDKRQEDIYKNTSAYGTYLVAKAMNETKAFTVAGGGDTEAALTKFDLESEIDWISSGGGAMLAYLAEGTLPFLKVISNR